MVPELVAGSVCWWGGGGDGELVGEEYVWVGASMGGGSVGGVLDASRVWAICSIGGEVDGLGGAVDVLGVFGVLGVSELAARSILLEVGLWLH